MRTRKTPPSDKTASPATFMSTETSTPTEPKTENANPEPAGAQPLPSPRLRLDDSAIKISYANFANATSTREETVLMFGMLQSYNRAQNEVPVQLNDRIVMSPFVARRLSRMLISLLKNYETRFGPLGEDS